MGEGVGNVRRRGRPRQVRRPLSLTLGTGSGEIENRSGSGDGGMGLRVPLRSCDGEAELERCSDGCGTDRWEWRGCGRPNCGHPGCQRSASGRRARRFYERLGRLEDVGWGTVVLTLPPDLHAVAARRSVLRYLADLAWSVVEAWAVAWCWRGAAVRIGGAVTVHPAGDSDPEEWFPHFNVIFPVVGVLDDGGWRKGRWHLPVEAIRDLRVRWRWALVQAGWSGPPGSWVQVHYRHRPSDRARRHASRYFPRRFPGWATWTQAVTYRGLLRDARWYPEGGDPLRWEDGEEKAQKHRCPRCGASMDLVEVWSVGRRGVRRRLRLGACNWVDSPPQETPPDLVRAAVERCRHEHGFSGSCGTCTSCCSYGSGGRAVGSESRYGTDAGAVVRLDFVDAAGDRGSAPGGSDVDRCGGGRVVRSSSGSVGAAGNPQVQIGEREGEKW